MNTKTTSTEPFRTNVNKTGDTLAGYRDVHMQLWPQTIAKMDQLKNTLHVGNKADAVRMAIDIALTIAQAVTEGGNLIIEEKNGKKSKLVINGLIQGS